MLAELFAALVAFVGLGGDPAGHTLQGYVEGDFLRVAAPHAGTLTSLHVAEGESVAAGAPLFALDAEAATATRDEAAAQLALAEAQLADLHKGLRPDELAAIEAQRRQAEAALRLAAAELERQKTLARTNVSPEQKLEQAEAAVARDRARVAELEAQYRTALLGGRADQIAAAEATVRQRRAALAEAEKRLADMSRSAPAAGLVDEVYFDPGEFVPAGAAVVALLPPDGVKLVFFVPQPLLGGMRIGQTVSFTCDSCPSSRSAAVTRIASEAEYTPPVIYSVGSRQKLVFRAEARPIEAPLDLHPGQPVDVVLP
jgi:HlyD family secretion protein